MNKKCINVLFALLLCFSLAGNGFAAPKSSAQDKGTVQDIVVRGTMLIDPVLIVARPVEKFTKAGSCFQV